MINQKNKYVTCGQMKLLERRADENGLSYYQMMENAGSGAAAVIREKMSESGRDRDVRYTGFISGYPDSDLPAVAETAAAPSAETGPMSALIFCDADVAENVGVSADHFLRDSLYHIVYGEAPLLGSYLRMHHYLQQQVSQLLAEVFIVMTVYSSNDFA